MDGELDQVETVTKIIRNDKGKNDRKIVYTFVKTSSGSDFHLQITDSEDPSFLYNFMINSAKFSDFQREARVECSFREFPAFLKDLLTKCQAQKDYAANINESEAQPIFSITLRLDAACVSLFVAKIIPATEKTLNEYLVQQTNYYKHRFFESQSKIEELQKQMILQNEKGITEKAHLEEDYQDKEKKLTEKYNSEITKINTEKTQVVNAYLAQIQSLEQKYQNEINQVKQTYDSEVQAQKKKREEEFVKYNEIIKKAGQKYSDLQSLCQNLKTELTKFQNQSEKKEKENELLKLQIDDLEKEKMAKGAEIGANQQYIAERNDQLAKLSEQILDQTNEIQKKDSENKQLEQNLNEAKQHLIELQQKLKESQSESETIKRESKDFFNKTTEFKHAIQNQLDEAQKQSRIKDEQLRQILSSCKQKYEEQKQTIANQAQKIQDLMIELKTIQKTNQALKNEMQKMSRANVQPSPTPNTVLSPSTPLVTSKPKVRFSPDVEYHIDSDPLQSPSKNLDLSSSVSPKSIGSFKDRNGELVTGFNENIPIDNIEYLI